MKEWFKDWFASKEYLEVYSHRDKEDASNLIKLILDSFDSSKKLKILDAACGAGRHSIILSLLGHQVTGFDLSSTLIKAAKYKATKLCLDTIFFQADIRLPAIKSNFDLIVNLFTSFGYFEDDYQNFSFVKTAYNLLNIDGIFAFDYLNKYYVINNLIPFSTKRINSKIIEETRMISDGRVNKNIKIIWNGKEVEYKESVKLYNKSTLIKNFEEIGFKIKKVFGDYNGAEFCEEKSSRLILIIQK